MRPDRIAAFVLALSAAVAGCGSPGEPLPPGFSPSNTTSNAPTAAEVQALVNGFRDVAGASVSSTVKTGTTNGLTTIAPIVQALTVPINVRTGETKSCNATGALAVISSLSGSISVTDTFASGTLLFEGTIAAFQCSENGKVAWNTPSGSPVRTNGSIFVNDTRVSGNIAISGSWTISDNNGRNTACRYDGALIQFDNLTGVSYSGGWACDGGLSGRLSG